ncbi:MAG: hypothetical protein V2A78_00545 [bacterium]
MLICTSICANYLPKAMALAESLRKVEPGASFLCCLLEREAPPEAVTGGNFDFLVLGKDLGIADFDSFIFKHSIMEASTAVKGRLFRYLLDHFPDHGELIYLDPDILAVSSFHELKEALREHSIVLTPHLTIPEEKDTYSATLEAVIDNELCALQHGVFNLGFLAIRRSPDAEAFINWWAARLDMFCYDDIARGIFTDQKWIDLAPCFFDVHILKHPGYNAAPWNLSMRRITGSDPLLANGEPLRFFHFSGFDSGANEAMLKKYVSDPGSPVHRLREDYLRALREHGQETLGKEPWSYDFFFSGERIDRRSRLAYRADGKLRESYPQPFAGSNSKFLPSWKNMKSRARFDLMKNLMRVKVSFNPFPRIEILK